MAPDLQASPGPLIAGMLKQLLKGSYPNLFCLSVTLGMAVGGCSDSGNQAQVPVNDQPKVVVANLGPEGDSGLIIDDVRLPLSLAYRDDWGIVDSYLQTDFTLTDGDIEFVSKVVDGQVVDVPRAVRASAVFYAQVFSYGSSFSYSRYDFATDRTNIVPGIGYFTNAYVGVDSDQNGSIEVGEELKVVHGTLVFTGNTFDFRRLNLSVTLSNGQTVTGEYTGLVDP